MGTDRNIEIQAAAEGAGKQHRRSKQERRQIVEETLRPGASVAVIARAHGVNANQVYRWQRLYRAGLLDVRPAASKLLPVRISEAVHNDRLITEQKLSCAACGTIYIEIGNARMRIEGAADPDSIRAALEGLRR
jgi:transposase